MSATPASIRLLFPEFGDTVKYPDTLFQAWVAIGVKLVNADRWGDLTDFGVSLFVAHCVAMSAADLALALTGRIPGAYSGILTSKGADGISAGYDVSSITIEGAGDFNLTKYGIRFIRFGRMMGAGPIQTNVPDGITPAPAQAWPGVITPMF